MYLGSGRKEDAKKIWDGMKGNGIKKQPGCSWIEINNSGHVFLSGDRSHTIYVNLFILLFNTKKLPNSNRRTNAESYNLISQETHPISQGYGAYAASKAAVETMAKIMAKELKGSGITVNCVAPGPVAVATELFFAGKTEETVKRLVDSCALGRFGKPEDVRKIVGFFAGDDGEWINGQIIRANGGSVV
ncbi:hypothetical protein EZV62_007573 [Acer yangbiense]|uniref:NAD(P)-binding domain-containing protein n=1 Tax=Acer yangbiense TaxID=1000413 RepID=A0A5C7IAY1_9ROSI|nr:hypothetical protein EZV62_007573 [Acer yangbiense]